MSQTVTTTPMKVEIRLQNCTLTPERLDYLKTELGHIPQLVGNIPQTSLHVDIHKHPRQKDFHIKMSLNMAGTTLFTGDRHVELMPAYRACINKMSANLKEFKNKRTRKHQWEREPEFES